MDATMAVPLFYIFQQSDIEAVDQMAVMLFIVIILLFAMHNTFCIANVRLLYWDHL